MTAPRPAHLVPEPDVRTIEACRRGDRQALETVFRVQAPALERLIVRLQGPKADVEDLLQTTLMEAIGAFPRFRGKASVRIWLGRIAVHVVHQHLRHPERRRKPVSLDLVRGDLDPVDRPSVRAITATPRPEIAAGPLALARNASVSLAHARVTADEASELSWDPAHQVVALREGALSVSVDPAPGLRFRVLTHRFAVEVLGTEFHVDLARVSVTHGIVRVLSPESEDLITELSAGQSWSVPPAPELAPAPSRGRSASAWLSRARRHLAAGAIATAEREVAAALGARPNRSETAEARTLLAECALVSGDPQRAAELYIAVSQRYADLPAGETALFAAARIQVNAGQRSEAEHLLRSYLDRYPTGRFQQEARARLRALERRE